MTSVLFVCMGNICRSPAGEIIFQHLIVENGLTSEFSCDSAGTIGFHSGNAPDHRMSATLEKRGYPIIGQSRQFRLSDFDEFDLILVMDRENEQNILALTRSHEDKEKVQLFCDFCNDHEEEEVPDPYYGGDEGFEHVANLVEDGASGLLTYLKPCCG